MDLLIRITTSIVFVAHLALGCDHHADQAASGEHVAGCHVGHLHHHAAAHATDSHAEHSGGADDSQPPSEHHGDAGCCVMGLARGVTGVERLSESSTVACVSAMTQAACQVAWPANASRRMPRAVGAGLPVRAHLLHQILLI